MENQSSKHSPLSILKECLSLWWTFNRGKEVAPDMPVDLAGDPANVAARVRNYERLTPRSRLFDRIGRLVFFRPIDMECRADFFYVPGDRRFLTVEKGLKWKDIARSNTHDNQTRVVVRELLSKKAAKAGIVVVVAGALLAPLFVQHMTPVHLSTGAVGATVRNF